jgi:FkbM family methyltransferase
MDEVTDLSLAAARRVPRKVARSALVRFPRVYDTITDQWRYRVYYRLGLVHEHEFRALPLLIRRPDPLVLDIGGNNGQSMLSIKRVLPDARVITFEPAARHAGKLQSLASRLGRVTVETYALSDEEGEATLHWPVYNGLAMHGLASLDPDEVMSWLGPDGIYGFRRELLSIATETVPVHRLDGLGLDPDIVKLDVQGAEAMVLRGALQTLERSRPAVMAEAAGEGDEVSELLRPLGYRLFTFHKGRFEPGDALPATNRFLICPDRLPA